MREKKEEEEDNTSKDQLSREIEKWSLLQLNNRDRELVIQLSDTVPQKSGQDHFTHSALGIWQSAYINDKTSISTNVMSSVSNTSLVSKSQTDMVTVWANPNSVYDDSGPDELLSIIKPIISHYWKNFKRFT